MLQTEARDTAARTGTAPSLRWGIVGTGAIARQFAAALERARHGTLVAVATRDPSALTDNPFGGARIHKGHAALFADGEVDAVYIASPHPAHAEQAIAALEAGKHVLCEKPLAMNAAEASAVLDVAARSPGLLMEAFMYRGHPQTRAIVDIIRSGEIGEVTMIDAVFGYNTAFDARKRHFDPELGGGAILDIGCYVTSMCRLVAGVARGEPFADPIEVKGTGHLGTAGADERAAIAMRFPGGILAHGAASITTVQDAAARIHGTRGAIEVTSPWFCSGRQGGRSEIVVAVRPDQRRVVPIETEDWLYALEADLFARSVAAGEIEWPAPSHADTLGNMRTLDAWRREIGLAYPAESSARRVTVAGHPLRRREGAPMPTDETVAPGKAASRLAIGGMLLKTFPDAAIVYDSFFEAGGTTFDSAWIYGQGLMDKLLGEWLQSRGVRDQAVVIGKGAHSPLCRPEFIAPQLEETLERLRTDHLDLYFMHRDNPDVPVGEFVDVLDALRRAGRIGKFGGSNWTTARIDEANAYAQRTGKHGFELLSNNYSLAEMVAPMWPGCISSSGPDDTAWLKRTQTPIFAWSSQARGFFTDRAGRDKLGEPTLVASWYSDTNFERRDRVRALAAARGVSPAHIALAYLFTLPFPVFPIIGPASLAELRDSLGVVNVTITPEEGEWLKTGEGAPAGALREGTA
ncbi:aldo/keto reductase [Propylenella binzhouense]|uniref:Oxidoreductase n=1 Tax=Propylenella binzhouense TaxID=2555902 RepID=A0A964T331_9HYPH|nr:aldo/keto reductase [Propylenella binzhouense]MYZ47024.1 oxidoreductase [Propylenella binzhouense]